MPRPTPPLDSIVFDLDGTLWDTCGVCAIGWNNVLHAQRIAFRTILAEDVRGVAGKPHDRCIREVFAGLSEAALEVLIRETQLEDNRLVAERGGELYPGVDEGLVQLAERSRLFIVSNCQDGYIEAFLDAHRFRARFSDFECWGRSGRPKSENLRALIDRNALQAPWMIGDTAGDQEAAVACAVPFVHARYGFGVCQGAQYSAANFAQLVALLLSCKAPSTARTGRKAR